MLTEAEIREKARIQAGPGEIFIGLCSIVAMLAAIFCLGFQILQFLQKGEWNPWPASDLFMAIDWINDPRSWLGAHKIVLFLLDILSVPSFIFMLGLIAFFYSQSLEIAREERERQNVLDVIEKEKGV